jgi:hypothetical protein
MSRLDDELRNAFRREPPAADFTERLLARVAQQPAPKPRWWQRPARLLDPPKLRWAAIGVTALLLLAIGAAQYSKLHRVAVDDNGKIAQIAPPSEDGSKSKPPATTAFEGNQAQPKPVSSTKASKPRRVFSNNRFALARLQKQQELRTEGEAAKEKLMLALYIASSALNDAQKAIHGDGPKP